MMLTSSLKKGQNAQEVTIIMRYKISSENLFDCLRNYQYL